MIGYFLSAGDENVSDMFSPYIWNENGFGTLFSKRHPKKLYGKDLKLLLIKYYVEGKFEVNGPTVPTVGNYSNKNKDISVAYTVRANDFHLRNEFDRRTFIIDSTLNAIKLVQEKLSKKHLEINFDELLGDVKSTANEFFIVINL